MPTTFDEIATSLDVEQKQIEQRRDRALAEIHGIINKARQEARANLTQDEDADIELALATRDRAEKDLVGNANKIKRVQQARDQEARFTAALEERSADPQTVDAQRPAYDRVARVGQEERVYHKGNCRRGGPFIRDVVAQFMRLGDMDAEQRLMRHMREERVERGVYLTRATGTGAFAGLTVPQYLTEMYAPAVAARRPFADAMTSLDLPPDGMTVNISQITTSSSAAVQATQNAAVSETDMDDTLLTINVQTSAGRQTISRQAIDRGSGIEEVTMNDLQRRFATNLDATIITQAATGLTNIATANTWDDTTPTGAEFYPKILAAASAAETALIGQANPDLAVMNSRRWYWLQNIMTSTWPLIGQSGLDPRNFGESYAQRYGSGARGLLPNGTVVIVDNNVPINLGAGTNQDEVYICPSEESYLWEDPNAPQFIRAEQTKAENLGVVLVLYGYFAYCMTRYANSHQKIAGTGLVTPTFTGS